MTHTAPKRNRTKAIVACLVILACLVLAAALIARSFRSIAPMVGKGAPPGAVGSGVRADFNDPSMTHYRGRVTAVDAAAGTITVETRDQGTMSFTIPSTARVIVSRQPGNSLGGFRSDTAQWSSRRMANRLSMLYRGPGVLGGKVVGLAATSAVAVQAPCKVADLVVPQQAVHKADPSGFRANVAAAVRLLMHRRPQRSRHQAVREPPPLKAAW